MVVFGMAAVARHLLTAADFAVWVAARPEKHWELFDGVPEMQQAQSWGHQSVILALYRLLYDAIKRADLDLRVGSQGLVVKIGPRTSFKPDVVVFSGEIGKADTFAPSPLIAVEVLSPSTARKDLTVKLAGYFEVSTIEHYLIADWEVSELIHYRRAGDGISRPVILNGGQLRLDPPGIEIPVADVFHT